MDLFNKKVIKELQAKIEELEKELEHHISIEREYEQRDFNLERCKALSDEVKGLEDRVSELNAEIKVKEEEVANSSKKLGSQQAIFKQLEVESSSMKQQKDALKNTIMDLQAQADKESEKLHKLVGQCEEYSNQKNDLHKEITDLEQHKQNSQEELNGIKKETEQLQTKLNTLNSEYEDFEENHSRFLFEKMDHEAYVLRKIKEKKYIDDTISNLNGHLRNLIDDKDDRRKIIDYIEDFVSLNDCNFNLRREIEVVKNELEETKAELSQLEHDKNKYWSEKKHEVRCLVMHDLYQRVNQTEFEALHALANDVDTVDMKKLKSDLDLKHAKYRDYFVGHGLGPQTILLWHLYLYKLVNEYLQMNVTILVRQMNTHSWDSIQPKALIVIDNIRETLHACNLEFKEDFEKVVLDYLRAKYLVVSKQKYEHEKEKEEREAQRDYERAIKKALKDEEKAQEQLEKKQREIEKAESATQIAKLNEQISKLKEALLNARELRERAQSMAQQTKCGYVYVISNIGSFGKDIYKIGMTRRLDPMDRILELSNASVPFPFDVHTFIYSKDAPTLEATLHRVFEDKKVNTVNYRKEYFKVSLDEIKTELNKLGIKTDFVDEPDAFQYRESKKGFSFFNEQV